MWVNIQHFPFSQNPHADIVPDILLHGKNFMYLVRVHEYSEVTEKYITTIECILYWKTSRMQINGKTGNIHDSSIFCLKVLARTGED